MQLLLLHGFRGNHLGLRDVAKFLRREGYEVFVPDIPPAGKYPLAKYDSDNYAKWVANYILEKKLDRPVLVGHSMGSIIAAATAEKYPELISEKIIFMSPISTKTPRFLAPLTPLSVLLPNSLISHITTRYLIVKKGKDLYKNTIDLVKRSAQKYTSRRDVMKAAIFSERHSLADFTFDRDVLLLAGDKDRLCPEVSTRLLATHLNHRYAKTPDCSYSARPEFIEGTGHLLNYEAPDLAASRISDFLNPTAK